MVKLSTANSTCVKNYAKLPLITNAQEDTDLRNKFKDIFKVPNFPIDLKRTGPGKLDWATPDGSKPKFTNWMSGEPNNGGANGEEYVMVSPYGGGWNDLGGHALRSVICQTDLCWQILYLRYSRNPVVRCSLFRRFSVI